MPGVITAHAEFKLAQLRTIAREAGEALVTAKQEFDEATERYAQWPDSYGAVQLQRERVEKTEANKTGSESILARYERQLADPEYQRLLSEADACEAKAAALDFSATFQPLGTRIEETAQQLAGLIAETLRVVDNHVKTQNALTIAAEKCGFGALYRCPSLDPTTGLARAREALERALHAAPVPDHVLRAATGIRL